MSNSRIIDKTPTLDAGSKTDKKSVVKYNTKSIGKRSKARNGVCATDHRKYNDPSYYGVNNPIGKQAANVSTAFVYGRSERYDKYTIPGTAEQKTEILVQSPYTGSIMLLKVSATMPNVSPSYYNQDDGSWEGLQSFDRAMVKFLIKLRGSKTSTLPWDAADLGVYTLSMGSILMLQGFIERTFADAKRVLPNNMLSPKALVNNMLGAGGYEDLIASYGDYLARYLKLAELLHTLPMPGNMPYFKRARSMCARWYTDDANFYGSNQYGFVPNYLFKYNALKTNKGGGCDVVGPITHDTSSTGTFKDILDLFEGMLDALILDEDIRNIGAWMTANWEEAFYVSPTFDESKEDTDAPNSDEILSMIMNSHTVPRVHRDGVIQDAKGRLLCKDYSFFNSEFEGDWGRTIALIGSGDKILNSYHDWTPEDAMVYTRFTSCYIHEVRAVDDAYVYKGDLFALDGTVVIVSAKPSITAVYSFTSIEYPQSSAGALNKALERFAIYSHFDYAPTIWRGDASTYRSDLHIACQRQSHLITLPNASLKVMNEVAIQAQFGLLE